MQAPTPRPRYAVGYGAEGTRITIAAAAEHFGWSPQQRQAELQRRMLRPLKTAQRARQDARPFVSPRPVRAAGVARERHARPRKANAPPDDDPDPEPPAPRVERRRPPLHARRNIGRLLDQVVASAAADLGIEVAPW